MRFMCGCYSDSYSIDLIRRRNRCDAFWLTLRRWSALGVAPKSTRTSNIQAAIDVVAFSTLVDSPLNSLARIPWSGFRGPRSITVQTVLDKVSRIPWIARPHEEVWPRRQVANPSRVPTTLGNAQWP